ncbi:MAG TPA: hypothetical protein VN089_20635 [Duganella sp.]|nr:hypothetical protein [Duganella sp.]
MEFEAQRLASPTLLWATDPALVPTLLRDYAFCKPLPGDPEAAFLSETRTFAGERYGGAHAAYNGGGVRCGEANGLSIKGIGQNALVGSSTSTDFFHSYGGASLNEGIAETVWGEVANLALPFGGVRVLGLIDTGTRVPLMLAPEDIDPTTKRALIIRHATPRAAHFMRAVYYSPSALMKRAVSDTERTRAAIGAIGETFNALYGGAPVDKLDPDYLNECLLQTFQRYAAQIAAARSKRIMHSAITDSNMTLDGSWLDFATATTVYDYGRIYAAPFSPDFTQEGANMNQIITDLLFYLKKYLPNNRGARILNPQQLIGHYRRYFNQRLAAEFIKLFGASEQRTERIDTQVVQMLYATLCDIRDAGNHLVHTVWSDDPGDRHEMPEQTGAFHLNTILSDLALCASPTQADEVLRSSLPDNGLRGALVDRYWRFRSALLSQFPVSGRRNAQIFLALNSLRLNRRFQEIHRHDLYRAIYSVVVNDGDVEAFVNGIVHKARTAFSEIENGCVDISAWFDRAGTLSEQDGIMLDGKPVSLQYALTELRPGILDERQKQLLAAHLELS